MSDSPSPSIPSGTPAAETGYSDEAQHLQHQLNEASAPNASAGNVKAQPSSKSGSQKLAAKASKTAKSAAKKSTPKDVSGIPSTSLRFHSPASLWSWSLPDALGAPGSSSNQDDSLCPTRELMQSSLTAQSDLHVLPPHPALDGRGLPNWAQIGTVESLLATAGSLRHGFSESSRTRATQLVAAASQRLQG